MVLQIPGVEEFDLRMALGHLLGNAIDALHQHAGEQEIGENDDAPVSQLHRVFQPRPYKRESDAAIADLAPAKSHAFPQHAGNLADVRIGVGVGRAAADDHQQRLGPRHAPGRSRLGCLNPLARHGEQTVIEGKVAAIIDAQARMLGRVGIEDRGYVVFHMTRGKKHAGDGQNQIGALQAQSVEPIPNDRLGELEET